MDPGEFMKLIGGILLIVALIWCYFLPYQIGRSRRVPHAGLLFLGNLLFGGTVLGWFIALVYAVTADGRSRPRLRPTTAAYYDTHDFVAGRSKGPRIEPRL